MLDPSSGVPLELPLELPLEPRTVDAAAAAHSPRTAASMTAAAARSPRHPRHPDLRPPNKRRGLASRSPPHQPRKLRFATSTIFARP
jgi:hypothetical protein